MPEVMKGSTTGLSFGNRVDELFGAYPCAFRESLFRYGMDFAVDVLEKKQFYKFDPMISDRSCQLRAIWLAVFYQKKTKAQELSNEEVILFGLARFLIETAYHVQHAVIGRIPLRTDKTLWPDELFQLESGKQRMRFFGKAKALVQERIVNDFVTWMKELPPSALETGTLRDVNKPALLSETLNSLRCPEFCSYSCVSIPLINFFPGFLIVISLAAYFRIDIVVLLRRIEREKNGALTEKERKIFPFGYNAFSETFEELKRPLNERAPVIGISSHFYLGNSSTSFSDFSKGLVSGLNQRFNINATVIDYIYAMAATHAMLVEKEFVECNVEIENAPDVTNLTRHYLDFSRTVGLAVSKTVLDIDLAVSQGQVDPELRHTPFEMTHICCDSIERLRLS
jgi:hypothetical protein